MSMFFKNFKVIASIYIVLAGLLVTNTHHVATVDVPQINTSQTVAKIDTKQIACLAKNIYYEAGSETISGQAAVARVVMNRIRHGFGKNPCAVVYQATINTNKVKMCQFSWVCEGKSDPNKQSVKYKQAEQVAYDVIVNDSYKTVVPKSALFFHNLSVDPSWPYRKVATIGNHIFYSKEKKKPKND